MKKIRLLLWLAFIIVIVAAAYKPTVDLIEKTLYPLDYEREINKWSDEFGVDEYLVMATIRAESNFIADAKSHKDAYGLMQVTEQTAKWICTKLDREYDENMLLNSDDNIMLGCWYIKNLSDYYGDTELALCAYNAGSGNVDKWLKNDDYSKDGKTLDKIPFEETKKYVEKVMKYKEKYEELYPGF